MLIKQDWINAIEVQNACNLSGVALSFAQVMCHINEEAQACGQGTDWKNRHPIVRLWVDKLADLAGMRMDFVKIEHYVEALHECQRRVAEWETGEEVVLEGHDNTNQIVYPWTFIRILSCRDALKKFDQSWWGYPHLRMVPLRDRVQPEDLLTQIIRSGA